MSMTLWLHVLEGHQMTAYEDDCYWLNEFLLELDGVCQSLGITALSSFLDYSDLSANIAGDGSEPLKPVDTEAAWPCGIDDMSWFAASEGLRTLTALKERLASGNAPGIPDKALPSLRDELDSCINQLSEPAAQGAQFHFVVVL